jgi:hypothetical protein
MKGVFLNSGALSRLMSRKMQKFKGQIYCYFYICKYSRINLDVREFDRPWRPILILIILPFVTCTDESGWDHAVGKSASSLSRYRADYGTSGPVSLLNFMGLTALLLYAKDPPSITDHILPFQTLFVFNQKQICILVFN